MDHVSPPCELSVRNKAPYPHSTDTPWALLYLISSRPISPGCKCYHFWRLLLYKQEWDAYFAMSTGVGEFTNFYHVISKYQCILCAFPTVLRCFAHLFISSLNFISLTALFRREAKSQHGFMLRRNMCQLLGHRPPPPSFTWEILQVLQACSANTLLKNLLGLAFPVSCPGPSVTRAQTDPLMAAAGREGGTTLEPGALNKAHW